MIDGATAYRIRAQRETVHTMDEANKIVEETKRAFGLIGERREDIRAAQVLDRNEWGRPVAAEGAAIEVNSWSEEIEPVCEDIERLIEAKGFKRIDAATAGYIYFA